MVYYSCTVSQSNSCNVVDFFLPGGSILQQQTEQSGHQTRRAVALQRAQSVAASENCTGFGDHTNTASAESDAPASSVGRWR